MRMNVKSKSEKYRLREKRGSGQRGKEYAHVPDLEIAHPRFKKLENAEIGDYKTMKW